MNRSRGVNVYRIQTNRRDSVIAGVTREDMRVIASCLVSVGEYATWIWIEHTTSIRRPAQHPNNTPSVHSQP